MCGQVFHYKHPLPEVKCQFSHLDPFIHSLNTDFFCFLNRVLRWKEDSMQKNPVIPQNEHPTVLLFAKAGWCSSERGNPGSQSGLASRDRQQAAGSKGPGAVSHRGESSTSGMNQGVLKSSPSPERGETLHMCVHSGGAVIVHLGMENKKPVTKIYIQKHINQELLEGVLAFVFCLSRSHALSPFLAQMCTASH